MFSFIFKNKDVEISSLIQGHYPNGASVPSSYAGAPNESNCTSCHTGNALSGNGINSIRLTQNGVPKNDYIPGEKYIVTLTSSVLESFGGFQAVAYNSSNVISGTFLDVSGSCAQVVQGRATHFSLSNASCNLEWVWEWIAPPTDEGDVTFYVSLAKSNGDNNRFSGEQVYLSQHIFGSTLSIGHRVLDKNDFQSSYSNQNNSVNVSFNSLNSGEMYFNLVDLTGKSVYTYELGNSFIGSNSLDVSLPDDLKNGIYSVNFFVHNNVMEQKIIIQK